MNSFENELYLLSGMMYKPESQIYIFDSIDEDYLTDPFCKAVFSYLKDNKLNKNIPTDINFFNKNFYSSEYYKKVKKSNYSGISLNEYQPITTVNYHLNEVLKRYDYKKVNEYMEMLEEIKRINYGNTEDIENVKEICKKILESREKNKTAQHINDILQENKRKAVDVKNGKVRANIVLSGWKTFDNFTQGYERGELIIILARSGMGKTRWVLPYMQGISGNNFNIDKLCYMFSIEESKSKICNYLIANKTGIDTKNLRNMRLTDEDLRKVNAVNFRDLPIIIDDERAKCDLDYIERRIEMMVEGYNCRNFFIDTINEINRGNKKRVEFMDIVSSRLKDLVKRYNCRIFALAQMNRQSEVRERNDHRPQPQDVKDADSIYQNCDGMIGLYYDDKYKLIKKESTPLDYTFEAIVLKTRDGIEGATAKFTADLSICRFDEDKYERNN